MLRILLCIPNDVLYSHFERNGITNFLCRFTELLSYYKCDDIVTIYEAASKFCTLVKRPFLMILLNEIKRQEERLSPNGMLRMIHSMAEVGLHDISLLKIFYNRIIFQRDKMDMYTISSALYGLSRLQCFNSTAMIHWLNFMRKRTDMYTQTQSVVEIFFTASRLGIPLHSMSPEIKAAGSVHRRLNWPEICMLQWGMCATKAFENNQYKNLFTEISDSFTKKNF